MSDLRIITGGDVPRYRLLVLLSALRLEAAGMKRRGTSVYAIVKREFNLKGSKQKVLEQFETYVKETLA
jgi:hypothetical protein